MSGQNTGAIPNFIHSFFPDVSSMAVDERHCVPHPSGRCVATFPRDCSGRTLIEGSHLPRTEIQINFTCDMNVWGEDKGMVVGEGFEPSKSMTADLQSAPFGRSGTPPNTNCHAKSFSPKP